jgi:prepilin-type N-terminal cleavage/methylation domain-containing protein
MMRRRAGFTLVELMVVCLIIGILARIAIPKYDKIRLRARAAAVVSELNVVRGAAYQAYENTGRWPIDAATGKVPTALRTLLPGSLSFTPAKGVSYDWLLSGMPSGDPARATRSARMGMGVSTTDAALRAELQRQLNGQPTYVTGTFVYWLIWGPTTKP